MDDGKKVWVPHPMEGFKLGRIVDIGADSISVEPFDSPGQVGNVACYTSVISLLQSSDFTIRIPLIVAY